MHEQIIHAASMGDDGDIEVVLLYTYAKSKIAMSQLLPLSYISWSLSPELPTHTHRTGGGGGGGGEES